MKYLEVEVEGAPEQATGTGASDGRRATEQATSDEQQSKRRDRAKRRVTKRAP